MKPIGSLTAGAMILGLALPAIAATTHVALPAAKTQGSITYLSGGIGHDQALAMKRAEKRYPLSMTFSEGKHAEYVANVDVSIKDKAGKTLLRTKSDGPIMLIKLPAGQYRVSAKMNGKTLQRTANVKTAGDTHLSFRWPQA